jgi:hypothetical protein
VLFWLTVYVSKGGQNCRQNRCIRTEAYSHRGGSATADPKKKIKKFSCQVQSDICKSSKAYPSQNGSFGCFFEPIFHTRILPMFQQLDSRIRQRTCQKFCIRSSSPTFLSTCIMSIPTGLRYGTDRSRVTPAFKATTDGMRRRRLELWPTPQREQHCLVQGTLGV